MILALYVLLVVIALAAVHPLVGLLWDWLQKERPGATPWV